MDAVFWRQRWEEGRIGFHQDNVTPLLGRHWASLALEPGSRVFVPLCGKSLDVVWLAAQGYRVLGVELSPVATRQFFEENELTPEVRASQLGTHFVSGGIEIVCGDAFAFDAAALEDCAAVYDRAALIALPRPMREAYVLELHARLPAGCRGLLVTLEYPQSQMDGPPFSVDAAEVERLYGRDWLAMQLERSDILAGQPRFADSGVTALHTTAWRILKTR